MEQDKLTTQRTRQQRTETTLRPQYIICHYSECGAIADGVYKCFLCNHLFCVNCMYMFCNKCNDFISCYKCGHPWLKERGKDAMDKDIFCKECVSC